MIGSIGSSSGGYDTASVQQMQSQAAAKLFRTVDANQDGRITEDELSQAMQAQGNQSGPSAAELFKQLDQGNKGYLTEQDLEAGLAKVDQGKQAQGTPKGGPGGGSSASSGTTTSYDPEDLNQDGTVTSQERIQYALNLYTAREGTQTGNQASVYA